MFISNKEKSDINEKFDQNKAQIENLVKHVGKLQVDIAKTEVNAIDDLLSKYVQMQKMYWGSDKKVKALEKQVNAFESHLSTVQIQNEVLYKQNDNRLQMILELQKRLEKLENKKPTGRPVGAKNKLVISADKVQAMKVAGVWDDPIKRINSIDQLIKEERERRAEHRKEKQRQYNRTYKEKQLAKKAAQKETA